MVAWLFFRAGSWEVSYFYPMQNSPSKIMLKPLIVSFSGTSLPGGPVKVSATYK